MNPQDPLLPSENSSPSQPKSAAKQLELYKKLLIGLGVVAGILLLLTIFFGARAFINSEDLAEANQQGQIEGAAAQKSADEKAFTAEKNSDFRTYVAPDYAGSFRVNVPKSWSIAVSPNDSGNTLSALSNPDFVENKLDKYALRFALVNKDIDEVKKPLDNLTKEKDPNKRKLNVEDITVSGIKGFRYTGQISSKIPNGTLVLVPLRDKTFSIQTDDNDLYLAVFNSIVANLGLNP